MASGGVSVGGSARIQGVGNVVGLNNTETNPAVKKAMFMWVAAVAVLFIFHVGGARI